MARSTPATASPRPNRVGDCLALWYMLASKTAVDVTTRPSVPDRRPCRAVCKGRCGQRRRAAMARELRAGVVPDTEAQSASGEARPCPFARHRARRGLHLVGAGGADRYEVRAAAADRGARLPRCGARSCPSWRSSLSRRRPQRRPRRTMRHTARRMITLRRSFSMPASGVLTRLGAPSSGGATAGAGAGFRRSGQGWRGRRPAALRRRRQGRPCARPSRGHSSWRRVRSAAAHSIRARPPRARRPAAPAPRAPGPRAAYAPRSARAGGTPRRVWVRSTRSERRPARRARVARA